MKNILTKALETNGIADDVEKEILKVKFGGMVNQQHTQAMYWVMMVDYADKIYYVTKIYLNVINLQADFAGQVDYEGNFDEMESHFKAL